MFVEKPFNLEVGMWKFQPSSICCSPPDAAQRALTLLEDLLGSTLMGGKGSCFACWESCCMRAWEKRNKSK